MSKTTDPRSERAAMAVDRRARRLVARWARRIRSLAKDVHEPAWAGKVVLLAGNALEAAREAREARDQRSARAAREHEQLGSRPQTTSAWDGGQVPHGCGREPAG